MWENTTPSTELPRDFCGGIGPLQLGVMLVFHIFTWPSQIEIEGATENKSRDKHNAELQRADPGIKSRGNLVLESGFLSIYLQSDGYLRS